MARPIIANKNTKERNKVNKMLKKIDNYSMMYQAFQNNEITEQQWNDFCLGCLQELMIDNKEILKKLKENA